VVALAPAAIAAARRRRLEICGLATTLDRGSPQHGRLDPVVALAPTAIAAARRRRLAIGGFDTALDRGTPYQGRPDPSEERS
jgi:hypothetical protein